MDIRIEFPRDAAGQLQPARVAQGGWWRVPACRNGRIACGDPANLDRISPTAFGADPLTGAPARPR